MAPNQVVGQSKVHTQILKRKLGICENFNKKKHAPAPVPYLNDDIMWNIFKRVPAISLFHNCRFLSKQYSKFISTQNFIKANFLESKTGILLKEVGKDVQVLKFMEFNGTQIVKVHHLYTSKEQVVVFSNSAGLSLLHNYHPGSLTLSIVNLVTKQSIPVPILKQCAPQTLVFDRVNMNHKLVSFPGDFDEAERKCNLTILLVDLDGSCKRIKGPKLLRLGCPVLLDGVLYCEANGTGLFCLDLSTETFSFLRWPIDVDPNSTCVYHIMDVGGFVAFNVVVDGSNEIYIWILRQEKWVRIIICANPRETLQSTFFLGCLGNDADIFVFSRDSNRLDAYNLKTKQWTIIKPADNNRFQAMHVTTILPLTSKMVSSVDGA